jgi:hypothetical protein
MKLSYLLKKVLGFSKMAFSCCVICGSSVLKRRSEDLMKRIEITGNDDFDE